MSLTHATISFSVHAGLSWTKAQTTCTAPLQVTAALTQGGLAQAASISTIQTGGGKGWEGLLPKARAWPSSGSLTTNPSTCTCTPLVKRVSAMNTHTIHLLSFFTLFFFASDASLLSLSRSRAPPFHLPQSSQEFRFVLGCIIWEEADDGINPGHSRRGEIRHAQTCSVMIKMGTMCPGTTHVCWACE